MEEIHLHDSFIHRHRLYGKCLGLDDDRLLLLIDTLRSHDAFLYLPIKVVA